MTKKEQLFIATVWEYYTAHGRHQLPWRQTTNPYLIAVSEIMLQQTQVDRVQPKYEAFIARWPTVQALAHSSLGAVLTSWQGLGYNRRAKLLHRCAQTVTEQHNGQFPRRYEKLLKLPGIGPYTAGAISAFAFNQPVPLLETNIKTVFIHHFFTDDTDVSDAALLSLVERTLDHKNPREWYWALMDYGSYLKRTVGNNIAKSAAYKKQSNFKGSDRQIRGALIRELSQSAATRQKLHRILNVFSDIRIDAQLEKLVAEGLVVQVKRTYSLPR